MSIPTGIVAPLDSLLRRDRILEGIPHLYPHLAREVARGELLAAVALQPARVQHAAEQRDVYALVVGREDRAGAGGELASVRPQRPAGLLRVVEAREGAVEDAHLRVVEDAVRAGL